MLRSFVLLLVLGLPLFAGTIGPGGPAYGIASVSTVGGTKQSTGTIDWVFSGATGPGTLVFALTASGDYYPHFPDHAYGSAGIHGNSSGNSIDSNRSTQHTTAYIPFVFGEPIEHTYGVYASSSGDMQLDGAASIYLVQVRDSNGQPITATFESVPPPGVPEPATALPVLLALAAVLAVKRRIPAR